MIVQQMIRDVLPQMPAAVQSMDPDAAITAFLELIRVYRVFVRSQGNVHLIPAEPAPQGPSPLFPSAKLLQEQPRLTGLFMPKIPGGQYKTYGPMQGSLLIDPPTPPPPVVKKPAAVEPFPVPEMLGMIPPPPGFRPSTPGPLQGSPIIGTLSLPESATDSELQEETQGSPEESHPIGSPPQSPVQGPSPGQSLFGILSSSPRAQLSDTGGQPEPLFQGPGSEWAGTISPPLGFQPRAPAPLQGSSTLETWSLPRMSHMETMFLPENADAPQIPRITIQPAQKWGAQSPFWIEALRFLPDAELHNLINNWAQGQQDRLKAFVARTLEARAHLLQEPPQRCDPEMLLGLQQEKYNLVGAWQIWISLGELWYQTTGEQIQWTQAQLQADTEDGYFKRLGVETQLQHRVELQKEEARLIARSDWLEHLHVHPPSPEGWRYLCQWLENGFDFGSEHTLFNAPIEVVRASDLTVLLTDQLSNLLRDASQANQLSPNEMWVSWEHLAVERLYEGLRAIGAIQPRQILWWSPKAFEIADVASIQGQTRLDHQNIFIQALVRGYSGHWASFRGHRPSLGRHGPFDANTTPRFTVIIRDEQPPQIDPREGEELLWSEQMHPAEGSTGPGQLNPTEGPASMEEYLRNALMAELGYS